MVIPEGKKEYNCNTIKKKKWIGYSNQAIFSFTYTKKT